MGVSIERFELHSNSLASKSRRPQGSAIKSTMPKGNQTHNGGI